MPISSIPWIKAYAVFLISGNEFGYAQFDLLGVAKSMEGARRIVSAADEERREHKETHFDLMFQTHMTSDNQYSYVGNRDQCERYVDIDCFGGFLIEEIEVLD